MIVPSTTAHNPPPGELVEERLVLWYFFAALPYLFISMFGGILMALQIDRRQPVGRHRVPLAGPLADDSYQCRGVWLLGQLLPRALHWSIPRLTLRPVANRSAFLLHLHCLASRRAKHRRRHHVGAVQGVEWGETPVWIDPLALAGLCWWR